jgi:predicted kinase
LPTQNSPNAIIAPTLYAMVGTIGSGKTTYAEKLSREKGAIFFSIDKHIKLLGQPIGSKENYDRYYFGVRDVIADYTLQLLNLGQSVVLDFGGSVGHWEWLSSLADQAKANIQIFHLIVPIEVRRERVRKRNSDPKTIFRFSDDEFNSMSTVSAAPNVTRPGLLITVIDQTN